MLNSAENRCVISYCSRIAASQSRHCFVNARTPNTEYARFKSRATSSMTVAL